MRRGFEMKYKIEKKPLKKRYGLYLDSAIYNEIKQLAKKHNLNISETIDKLLWIGLDVIKKTPKNEKNK
jgi:hypothetical protein